MKTHGNFAERSGAVGGANGHGDMLVITDRGFPFPRHEMTKMHLMSLWDAISPVSPMS